MKNKRQSVLTPVLIFSNFFPILGVILYNWTIFSVVYIYWVEMLIASTFSLFKILMARGGEEQITMKRKIAMSVKFFIFRTGIFFFYLSFIVVFLGFMVSGHSKDGFLEIALTMGLKQGFIKLALLNFIVYNFLEFYFYFFKNGYFTMVSPEKFYSVIDGRMIVVHIVVIVGTFTYQFLAVKMGINHTVVMAVCVFVFAVVKTFADMVGKAAADPIPIEEGGFI